MKRLVFISALCASLVLHAHEPVHEVEVRHVRDEAVHLQEKLNEQRSKLEVELAQEKAQEESRRDELRIAQAQSRLQEVTQKSNELAAFVTKPEREITQELLQEQERAVEDIKTLVNTNELFLARKLTEQFTPAQQPAVTARESLQKVSGFQKALATIEKSFLKSVIQVTELLGARETAASYREKLIKVHDRLGELQEKLQQSKELALIYEDLGLTYGDMGNIKDALNTHRQVVENGLTNQDDIRVAIGGAFLLRGKIIEIEEKNPLIDDASRDALDKLESALDNYFGLVGKEFVDGQWRDLTPEERAAYTKPEAPKSTPDVLGEL